MPPRPKPAPTPPTRRWASQRQAAAYAGIGLRTLCDLIYKGQLPAYKLGPKLIRVDLNELDAIMVPTNGAAGGDGR